MYRFLQIVTLFVVLNCVNVAQNPLYWQNPKPTGNSLLSVDFVDELNGWAVGRNGTIINTTNGGYTWYPQESGTWKHLKSVTFFDYNNGWSVGDSGTILRTTNGGLTWLNRSLDIGYAVNAIEFLTLQKGFICTGEGKLLTTNTGGNSWSQISGIQAYYLTSIFFLDNNNGWVGGYNSLYKTSDGGQSWTSITLLGFPQIVELNFIDGQNGIATLLGGEIIKTTNGGATWNQIVQNLNNSAVRSAKFFDQTTLFAVTSRGGIFKSVNGGVNWTLSQQTNELSLNKIVKLTSDICWIVGDNGFTLRSSNSGNSWAKSTIYYTDKTINDLVVFGTSKGCAVTSDGKILRSTNGGATWEIAGSSLTQPINKIHFSSSKLGWAVGDLGAIFKTTDGGLNWLTVYSGTVTNLLSVYFIDSLNGWASGSQGKIMKTTNGGESWFSQSSGYNDSINAIYFINPLIGFIATNTGGYKSTNGGTSWTYLSDLWIYRFNDVKFINETTGWFIGAESKIFKTTNGGDSWLMQFTNSNFTSMFRRIIMTSENQGMVVGGGGNILRTTNGGNLWERLPKITEHDLHSIAIDIQSNIWVSGTNGTILSTVVPIIPVNLTSFSGESINGNVELVWETSTETNNRSFVIERKQNESKDESTEWKEIAEIPGGGSVTRTQQYKYIDLNPGIGSHQYRLKQIDFDGSVRHSEIIEIDITIESQFALSQNYPNPFNPSTTIEFTLVRDGITEITFYDVMGNKVRELNYGNQKAGVHRVTVDFTGLSSGIYVYELKSGDLYARRKMIFLK